MSAIKAKNNYIGVGCTRMNCAQAVLSAFQEKFSIEDEMVEEFEKYGGGRAPGGLCGACYAAGYILSRYDTDKEAEFKEYFLENAGALECRNIKGLRRLSCVGCVEKSSEFLDKL